MRFGLDNISISVRSWPKKEDFERFINRAANALEIEGEIEQEKEFFSLTLQAEPDGQELWTVGIRTEGHGISPEVSALPHVQQLVIGANTQVHFLSWTTKRLTKTVNLGSLFRSFIVDQKRSLIIVVHEAGVAVLSMDGSQRWELTRDLVEAVHIHEDRLEVSFMDEAPISVAIDTGRELLA